MALHSLLFRNDKKLEAAAVSDPAHIMQGAQGGHVLKIQQALIQLDLALIAADGIYGPKTAAAVAAYKRKRKIFNYQGQIDNIVGKKTTASLDREMAQREKDLANALPALLLAFAISPPPVPAARRFKIRTALIGSPTAKAFRPFRIYQIADMEHHLSAFYAKTDFKTLSEVRFAFANLKVLDVRPPVEFKTRLPIQVTGFEPEPCTEILIKTQDGPSRERVELSLPIFQTDGLTVNIEGFMDDNPAHGTITSFGVLLLIERTPRSFP